MDSNKEIISKVEKEFPGVYKDSVLNRKKLANIVFNDKDKLEVLNNIVHPAVREAFDEWVDVQESVFKDSEYLIEEAAIAIELGIQDRFDYIVVLTASEDIRIEIVMSRDNCTEEQVRERMNNQVSEDERLSHADSIIKNNNFNALENQVKLIHKKILKKIETI